MNIISIIIALTPIIMFILGMISIFIYGKHRTAQQVRLRLEDKGDLDGRYDATDLKMGVVVVAGIAFALTLVYFGVGYSEIRRHDRLMAIEELKKDAKQELIEEEIPLMLGIYQQYENDK